METIKIGRNLVKLIPRASYIRKIIDSDEKPILYNKPNGKKTIAYKNVSKLAFAFFINLGNVRSEEVILISGDKAINYYYQ